MSGKNRTGYGVIQAFEKSSVATTKGCKKRTQSGKVLSFQVSSGNKPLWDVCFLGGGWGRRECLVLPSLWSPCLTGAQSSHTWGRVGAEPAWHFREPSIPPQRYKQGAVGKCQRCPWDQGQVQECNLGFLLLKTTVRHLDF